MSFVKSNLLYHLVLKMSSHKFDFVHCHIDDTAVLMSELMFS